MSMPIDTPRAVASRIHDDVELLLRLATQPRASAACEPVVERHIESCLDVRAGVALIEGLAEAGTPISAGCLERWARFLQGKEAVWSALFKASKIDAFEDDLVSIGLTPLAGLDWALVRVLAANREGISVMETGRTWKDGLPTPEHLGRRGFAEAMRLVVNHVDSASACLHMGESVVDGRELSGLNVIVDEWLEHHEPGLVARWRWLAKRVAPSKQTDGLYGSSDAEEAFAEAFGALALPTAAGERAAVLELLLLELPRCLVDEGLRDTRDRLAAEFGVEDDVDEPVARVVRGKITRALRKMARATPPLA